MRKFISPIIAFSVAIVSLVLVYAIGNYLIWPNLSDDMALRAMIALIVVAACSMAYAIGRTSEIIRGK
jgi:hypothetical protein